MSIARMRAWIKNRQSATSLLRCEAGNSMMLFGLSLVPVIGFVGLALDGGQWMLWKRQLHTAADLGALAGAYARGDGKNVDSAVRRSLAKNNTRAFNIVAIQSPPTSGAHAGQTNAIYVELTTQEALPFSSMFINAAPVIKVTATAVVRNEVPNCVIALDDSNVTALEVGGSASLTMNCGMGTNASGSEAAEADGQYVNVAAISAVGQVEVGSSVTASTKINEGISPIADPYEGRLNLPDLSTSCSGASAITVGTHNTQTISQGCYSSLSVSGTLRLNPGIYYIDGGNVEVGSQGYLQGDNVVLIFTNSDSAPGGTDFGKFKAQGTSMVQLSGRTSGTYEGVVMYQDRRATPASATNFFVAGNSGTDNAGNAILSYIQGSIYTPSTHTTVSGNSSLDTDCMQLVARRVVFTGNTTILNTCSAGSGAQAYGGTKVARLVE